MQTNLSLHPPRTPSNAQSPECQGHADEKAALVESREILRGQKAVSILHNGALYRLQATKLGKLILTK